MDEMEDVIMKVLARKEKSEIRKFLERNTLEIALVGFPILGLVIGIIIGMAAKGYMDAGEKNDYGRHMVYKAYTVKSDDTVWGIAEDLTAVSPEFGSIERCMKEIENVNNIKDGGIQYGQVIYIPYYTGPDGLPDYGGIYEKYGIGGSYAD